MVIAKRDSTNVDPVYKKVGLVNLAFQKYPFHFSRILDR
jgi:hypothetical protein